MVEIARQGLSRRRGTAILLCTFLAASALDAGQSQRIQQFIDELGDQATVSVHPATGAARFVRLGAGAGRVLDALTAAGADPREKSDAFLAKHSDLFGIADAGAELALVRTSRDAQGGTHFTYAQRYRGVPVFGALLKTHFDAGGRLRVINGTTVPDIERDVSPARTGEEAGRVALALVSTQRKQGDLSVRARRLYVYRSGLAKGAPGPDHLVFEVEVGNGRDIREIVYVDAHNGKVVDRTRGIDEALSRRAYQDIPNFPGNPFWTEGDAFPTSDTDADDLIAGSGEAYALYRNAFGRDSYDGLGHTLHGIFAADFPGGAIAFFNDTYVAVRPGGGTDDIIGHEWTHAYTRFTHDLVSGWQPGALNEAYSNIFGEVVDQINGRGSDSPGGPRSAGLCSTFSNPYAAQPALRVNSPVGIAGSYPVGLAQFGPPLTAPGLTADLVLADDGTGGGVPPAASRTDGCCAAPTFECAPGEWANAAEVAGKIALVDRGTCLFPVKVKNAQLQGAVGVVVANHSVGGDQYFTMFGSDPTITIPAALVGYTHGTTLASQIPSPGVNATLRSNAPGFESSYRWLIGEDVFPASSPGAFHDLWTPTCVGQPGKVSDAEYTCADDDSGGIHTNSSVPGHAFALLVDGGTYNGHTVSGLGVVKASHIYFRAMSVYQGPFTDFRDHADSLEQSCQDLVGVNLTALVGGPSGQVLTPGDCDQVTSAMAAVEMRRPSPCGPLPGTTPPNRCEAGTTQVNLFADDFETDPLTRWAVTRTTIDPTFTPRDWQWLSRDPGREGGVMFAADPNIGTCEPGTGDESGVLHLTSPAVTLPPGAPSPRLTFDHFFATEIGYDGGNAKVSVNGGPWQVVAPGDFTYYPYNLTLIPPEGGNTNPMAGEPAFSSMVGPWGRSHANLGPYAGPGDTLRLRFDLGSDGCTGWVGWYVDDPTVYACVPSDPPQVAIGDAQVTEGDTGFTAATFTISLSHASAQPVSVWYVTVPGTAWPFFDFVPALKQVTFAPLQLQKAITVQVRGDRVRENDEAFFVLLLAPGGAIILDGTGRGTIVDDDHPH